MGEKETGCSSQKPGWMELGWLVQTSNINISCVPHDSFFRKIDPNQSQMGTRVSNVNRTHLELLLEKIENKSRPTGEAQISEDKTERNDEGYEHLMQI